jgi:hypothetical protein
MLNPAADLSSEQREDFFLILEDSVKFVLVGSDRFLIVLDLLLVGQDLLLVLEDLVLIGDYIRFRHVPPWYSCVISGK